MSRIIRFTAFGTPVSQGNLVRGRYGGIHEKGKKLAPWRDNVAKAAAEAMVFHDDDGTSGWLPPFTGPVFLTLRMYFPRPKHHFGTGKNASILKPGAPDYVITKPDGDKCLRAIFDGITGVVIRDDSQVARVFAQKQYGEPARAEVIVCRLDEDEA